MITNIPKMDRRAFVIGTAAVGAGLTLGLKIPFGTSVVRAQDGAPEINAWVVIRPDDTVVVRIARSEMGQGTLTGLAQMVAEELDCDWSKVTVAAPRLFRQGKVSFWHIAAVPVSPRSGPLST